jgi:methylated-DNA-[protein]-cysteine S-methyltransferase
VRNNNSKFDAIIETPFTHLGLQFQEGVLTGVEYLKPEFKLVVPDQAGILQVVDQLASYFTNPAHRFDLEIHAKGTDFQQRVWREMCQIPAGQVKTYGEVADILSTSPRAVGNACRANPIPLIIPCHRIVSAAGMGGFAGTTSGYFTDIKRQLLRHEGLEF